MYCKLQRVIMMWIEVSFWAQIKKIYRQIYASHEINVFSIIIHRDILRLMSVQFPFEKDAP